MTRVILSQWTQTETGDEPEGDGAHWRQSRCNAPHPEREMYSTYIRQRGPLPLLRAGLVHAVDTLRYCTKIIAFNHFARKHFLTYGTLRTMPNKYAAQLRLILT